MKILVLGGSGFLGSHVADSLSENGHNVAIFDIRPSNYIRDDQRMIIGDITSEDCLDKAINGMDIVMNFAGISDLDEATTNPIRTIELNILGTAKIMELCIKYKVKRFVYASSFYVHSDKGGFYRCSKQAAEIYIEEYNRKYGLQFTILRYGTLYGPRSNENNSIYRYIKQAVTDKEIICAGTGNEIREYIHVKDAAELTNKILEEKFVNKHIILTGHHSMKVDEMLNMLKEIIDESIPIKYLNKKSEAHYKVTPYKFNPTYSFKLVDNYYRDMGYGLVETIKEVYTNQTNE